MKQKVVYVVWSKNRFLDWMPYFRSCVRSHCERYVESAEREISSPEWQGLNAVFEIREEPFIPVACVDKAVVRPDEFCCDTDLPF